MSNINTGIADGGHASVKWSAMIKPLIVLVAVAALLLAAIYGWQSFVGRMMKKGMAAAATAPQVVSAIAAKPTVWQSQLHAVGSLRAVRGADLAAEIGGVVDALNFDSGNQVQAGAVLLRLRLNDDPAKLLQLQAAAELAEQNYKRDQEQFAAQAISQAVLDSDASTLKSARAAVTAQQALIGEKIVKAPFAGRLGIRQVDLGQYLSPGTTIVTLQALDPILIDFEADFDFGHAAWSRQNAIQLETTECLVVHREVALALKHVNVHGRLIIHGCREQLGVRCRYGGVSLDKACEHAALRFDTQ